MEKFTQLQFKGSNDNKDNEEEQVDDDEG